MTEVVPLCLVLPILNISQIVFVQGTLGAEINVPVVVAIKQMHLAQWTLFSNQGSAETTPNHGTNVGPTTSTLGANVPQLNRN